MTKKTKTLVDYINVLPLLGSLVLSGGVLGAIVILSSKHASDWSPYYFYFKALGAILGYLYVSRGNPGGRVTLNFDKSAYNEDEKALYNLVVKYRSNTLMVSPLILYLIADFMIGKIHAQTHVGSFEGYVASVIMGSFITLTTTMGVKYLSAWWNIRKNWKKEFEN